MKKRPLLIGFLLLSLCSSQTSDIPEKWIPFNYFIGMWIGTGIGKFGQSIVERKYEYFMGATFILAKNKSIYQKQAQNLHGEIHDNWDIISYDKDQSKYVLRQFHAEDIINTYSADSSKIALGIYSFESESIENFRLGWKARETYKILNEDEFIEIFYLSPPNGVWVEYVRNHFKRIQ